MSAPRTFPVDAAGHTLRGDVAAAYLRAIAAGMPTGGVDVFQRTMAEQTALYNRYLHGGPIAAYPTWHAPHIDGRAMDFHTTTAGKYAPSAAFVWAMQGAIGQNKPKAGEKPRIREFGFYRSVPSERWHLEYDRALDKYRDADLASRLKVLGYASLKAFQKANGLDPDGIDGPITWAALLGNPIVVPPPWNPIPDPTPGPQPVDFRAATYNAQLQHFGGGPDSADAAFVDDVLRPSVLAAQEVSEAARISICEATDFKVWAYKTLGIFWYPGKYNHGSRIEVDFKTAYHGMIGTELTSLKNGNTFVAASVHVRPRAAFSSAAKAKDGKANDIKKVIAALAKYPRVLVGGDWSSDARAQMQAAGYRLVTPYVDTYDKPGVQRLDFLFERGLDDRTGGSEHPTSSSDHDGMVANLTLPAPVSSL